MTDPPAFWTVLEAVALELVVDPKFLFSIYPLIFMTFLYWLNCWILELME